MRKILYVDMVGVIADYDFAKQDALLKNLDNPRTLSY